jgi:hypothetical protein
LLTRQVITLDMLENIVLGDEQGGLLSLLFDVFCRVTRPTSRTYVENNINSPLNLEAEGIN